MTIFFHLLFLFLAPHHFSTKDPAPVSDLHPFYISVTEVTQPASARSLEVSCKFFADDFEETLRVYYKTKLDITAPTGKSTLDKLIPDYISKHLSLVADGRPLALTYIGFEKDKESVFCYFEVPGKEAVKKLQVTNTLLHEFKTEQINIMHVTIGGKRQSTKLDFPEKSAQFQFN